MSLDHVYAVKIWDDGLDDGDDHEVAIATQLGLAAAANPDLPFPIVKGGGRRGPLNFLISELAVGDINQLFALARKHAKEGTLEAWCAQFPNWGVATTLQEWKGMIFARITCALKTLHAYGYAHLDAHRGNFMCLESGKVVIHDFGTTVPITSAAATQDAQMLNEHYSGWSI